MQKHPIAIIFQIYLFFFIYFHNFSLIVSIFCFLCFFFFVVSFLIILSLCLMQLDRFHHILQKNVII